MKCGSQKEVYSSKAPTSSSRGPLAVIKQTTMITTHFSNIETVLIDKIKGAKTEIKIAVAWFNNNNIFSCLLSVMPKVSVTLLLSNDKNNYDNGIDFSEIISAGGRVFLPIGNRLMHNKYLIVDNDILITGSYNFTFGAEYSNDENIIVVSDELIVSKYADNFNSLIESSLLVTDFYNEIKQTEDASRKIFEQPVLTDILNIDIENHTEELDQVAFSIIEQYNLGQLETTGRAILSLVEDILHKTDNQKLLKAAYLTFVATGETVLAERYLKKIKHHDLREYKAKILAILSVKVKLTI